MSMTLVKLSELIAPSFYDLHKSLKNGQDNEYWVKGGRGSTKSSFISIEIILGLLMDPEANAVVMRRYQNELRDTVYGQMVWAINKMNLLSDFACQVSPMQMVYKPTGQKVVFKGADDPKKTKSINLGRGYIKYAWFEEVDQYGSHEEVRAHLQSYFRGTQKQQVSLFSYNPPKSSRSWVNREVKLEKAGRVVHHSDYTTVPVDWLGDRFIMEADHLKATNETAYRHEYLGEEVGTGLEVFTNVEVRRIPGEEIARFDHIRQGLDFGYAVDPMCFLRMHYTAKKRELYIFGEISGIGISNRQFVNRLPADYRSDLITADSAEPKSIDELRREYSLKITGAKKGPGSVEHGVKWLSDLHKIVIDPNRCPLAAREFVNYALETNRQGDIISKYPDRDNHSIDTTRYALETDMKGGGAMRAPSVRIPGL